ncbi:PBP1A family penicillin-binding protein [Alphaproteobacteria bacterium]|nr:PBP1A family penicillin-binding protein [Alphaproteobacteria bacterium]
MKALKKLSSTLIFLIFFWIAYCVITLPDLDGLGNKTRKPSISVMDSENTLVGSLGDVYGGLIQSENIPQNLINAVVVLEDKRFFQHFGVDIKGLSRAIFENIKEMRYSQGASTITQQLSKLIFLNADKTLSRKLRELIISFYLEYRFTKIEILSMYLNRAYFGSGQYGIKAASKRYFSKIPKDLSIAESAILAGILKAPSKLSLITNKEASISRAMIVLNLLEKNHLISYKQKKNADLELIKIRNLKFYSDNEIRYFIDWIYSTTPEEILNNKKDLIINTTLDLKVQKKLESSVKSKISKIDENIQTAVIVMDYYGAVKALLGGRSWNKSKFNRATQSKRQLGSVFKTYVYLTALSMGYELTDKIQDTPIKKESWEPKNFSNKYEGIISIKKAFAISSNVAAIRLAEKVGRENIIKQAKKLGITSTISNNPSMALGVDSFSLLETVGSFGALCGYGIPVIPYGITEIKQRDNLSLWKKSIPKRNEIITKEIQLKIKKLLRAVIEEGTGIKASKTPINIMGKTGTSQKNRDAWFIGCAKGFVVGVWVGRDDDKSMKNVFGSTLPLSIFKEIMKSL